MVGEYECLHQSLYLTTVVCNSHSATVFKIKKEDLLKVLSNSEEALKFVKAQSLAI